MTIKHITLGIANKRIKSELEHIKKTGIPRCLYCKTEMINCIDNITKKKSKYLWKNTCKHNPNIILNIG